MCLVRAVMAAAFAAVITSSLVYLIKGDDSDMISRREFRASYRSDEWRLNEDRMFFESGICSSENNSYVETCSHPEPVDNLHALQRTKCFCDDSCHVYHDCCIDYVLPEDRFTRNWSCREVRGQYEYRFPVYVLQSCPSDWEDAYVRRLCETESDVLEQNREHFTYLQDIPVKSERTGLFYRNVFCAVCNRVSDFVKWKSYFYCPANISNNIFTQEDLDFSMSVYKTRTKSFKNVKIGDTFTNCRLVIEDFNRNSLLVKHGARLCKPVIDTCSSASDAMSSNCEAYTSFVYESVFPTNKRKVYKNFHCALCNNANIGRLRCLDPLYPVVYTEVRPTVAASLSFLFDFNFVGGGNQVGDASPCKLEDGQIWDPVLKRCMEYTCGTLFKRKGSVCVPVVAENLVGGLNSSCPKRVIKRGEFYIYENGSVFVNDTRTVLSVSEYEAYEMDSEQIMSVAICAVEGSFLMHLSKVQHYLSEVTLSLSIICLMLHLFVYGVLKDLRNCPGKILMSLSTCLLCGHVFFLIGFHIQNSYWVCYVCGVLMHFGYLSSFLWMNVMAYDIYRTFSVTQSRNAMRNTFMKYSLYCWSVSLSVTTASVLFDNIAPESNGFRPKYGSPICWFNQRKGVLIFFILPIFALLIKNAVLFTISAFRINKISQQTKMVGNFSDRVRYFLYVKLSIVFGLTWVLGFLAGILQVEFLWYLFIILNGLQGVFIFISFTIKRKILKKLLIKSKVHSDKYKFSKDSSAFKKAMYSSLSNLTTLTAHLPASEENSEILKSVRKINPDTLIKERKL